jgi:hypothetical protein
VGCKSRRTGPRSKPVAPIFLVPLCTVVVVFHKCIYFAAGFGFPFAFGSIPNGLLHVIANVCVIRIWAKVGFHPTPCNSQRWGKALQKEAQAGQAWSSAPPGLLVAVLLSINRCLPSAHFNSSFSCVLQIECSDRINAKRIKGDAPWAHWSLDNLFHSSNATRLALVLSSFGCRIRSFPA